MARNRNRDGGDADQQNPNAIPVLVLKTAKEITEGFVYDLKKKIPVVDSIVDGLTALGLTPNLALPMIGVGLQELSLQYASAHPMLRDALDEISDLVVDRLRIVSLNTPYRDVVRIMDEMKKEAAIRLREIKKRWEKPSFAMIEDTLEPDDRKKSYEMVQKFEADPARKERWAKCQDFVGSKARVVFMLTLDTPEKQLTYLEGLREPSKKKEPGPVEVVAEKIFDLIEGRQSAVTAKLATKVGVFKDKAVAFEERHRLAADALRAENHPLQVKLGKFHVGIGFCILCGLLVVTTVVIAII